MIFEIYVTLAVLTGGFYTWFIYVDFRLDSDLASIGLAKAPYSLQLAIGFILAGLVFVLTTLLAPMVWVDAILGNLKPQEENK